MVLLILEERIIIQDLLLYRDQLLVTRYHIKTHKRIRADIKEQ
jgi:hypothetical protein